MSVSNWHCPLSGFPSFPYAYQIIDITLQNLTSSEMIWHWIDSNKVICLPLGSIKNLHDLRKCNKNEMNK